MIQCPSCSHMNEDGALFCESCKADLSAVAAPMMAEAMPMEAMPVEAMPMEAMPVEAMPMEAAPVEAAPVEAAPVEAAPVEAAPVEAAPIAAEAAPVVEAAPPPPPPPMMPAAAPAAPAAAPSTTLPAGAVPTLVSVRSQKPNTIFPICGGQNFIGRSDDKPVDIDLDGHEPEDKIFSSRQHALINYDDSAMTLTLEDLNSANGTYLNRARVYPGQPQPLKQGDIIQIGTVQLRVKY